MGSVPIIAIPLAAIVSLHPAVSASVALLAGIVLALVFGNPYADLIKRYTHRFLAIAIVGLGAGINLEVIAKVGFAGIAYTAIGLVAALFIGTLLGRVLKNDKNISLLVTFGTAICGGSAIAAMAPVIRAKNSEVSVALGTVFILNATALLLFPWIGHYFHLTETQFGLWAALAIHDTSSVVGATIQYGDHAAEIGTTVKLARALWIVPCVLLAAFLVSQKRTEAEAPKTKWPWFILGFLLAAALVTYIPQLQPIGQNIYAVAKRILVFTLFCIGAGLTRQTVKAVGFKPFFHGVALWIIVIIGTLYAVISGWIH